MFVSWAYGLGFGEKGSRVGWCVGVSCVLCLGWIWFMGYNKKGPVWFRLSQGLILQFTKNPRTNSTHFPELIQRPFLPHFNYLRTFVDIFQNETHKD